MNKFTVGCLGVGAVFVVVAVMIAFWLSGRYNGLVSSKQEVDAGWAEVQNQYQRRADLIPNLVQTVAGAANFEKSVLVEVTEARASVGQVKIDPAQAPSDPAQLRQFQQAQDSLGGALSRLLVVAERYPDLKANANFQNLQAQLEGTENRISTARNRFNEAAKVYNTAIQTVPNVFFAAALGFTARPYFEAKAGSDTPPAVQFDFNSKK